MTAAIVLAAGKSRRMGTQKLLLPVRGRPLIAHIVSEILLAGVTPVIVVLSPESPAVAEALAAFPVSPIFNSAADSDMLSSIRCGLQALPVTCPQFFVVPADQPGLGEDLIRNLINARQHSGKSLAVPICGGKRGHPVLVGSVHREEILTRHDATGLRGLFQAHPLDILEVPVNEPHALEDVDFPGDVARLSFLFDKPAQDS